MAKTSDTFFVVDDDRFHLELMQALLTAQGKHEIQLFTSGMECLQEIHRNPSVVFLDHHMDIYSGYEILRKIKRHNPNIFVVMVSAQEEIETAVNTLKYGAFDYLQKDANLGDKILSVLERIEEVKGLLRERKPSRLRALFNAI